MLKIFDVLTSEYLWAVPVFIITLIVAFLLVSRGSSAAWVTEAIRSFFSLFYAPWQYLRRTVRETSLGESDPRLGSSDQYLLARFLTIIRVGFVSLFLLGTAVVIVASVEAFLPPVLVRQELHVANAQMDESKQQSDDAKTNVLKDDKDWADRRGALVSEAQSNYKVALKSASDALSADETAISGDAVAAAVLPGAKNFVESRSSSASAGAELKAALGGVPSLGAEQVALFAKYCDDFDSLQALKNHPPRSEDDVRAEVQPNHAKYLEMISGAPLAQQALQAEIAALQKEVNDGYSPGTAAISLFSGIGFLLLYVWGYGVLIELFSMVLYLLADVKGLRLNSDLRRQHMAVELGGELLTPETMASLIPAHV